MEVKSETYDHLFKLLLVGDTGVGKSSILLRFCDDKFDEHMQSTIGVDFKVKYMEVEGRRLKVTIWDTAGQERFRTLTSAYYRGAQGVILVYDVSRRETFESLEMWLKEVNIYSTNTDAVKLLVGNKIDMAERAVSKADGEAFARSHSMMFIETSAKTKVGIQQAYEEVVRKILDNPSLLLNTTPAGARQLSSITPNAADQAGCSC
eukprot:GILJ01001569.1.p1 GENE.GILJ01001569.1~~GILJ01001569.1.p1  ORF type:complete len:206 (-),score=21.95 GILJ01001569.1:148-765(-)